MKNYFKNTTILFLFIFTLITCKKEPDKDKNTTPPTDCVIAETFFTDSKNIVDEAGYISSTSFGILTDTFIHIIFDSISHSDADTITINFGFANHLCNDGRNRKGKITAMYNTVYADTSASHQIIFDNYYVDNNKINGVIKDCYKGYDTTGHIYFMDTINGSIVNSSGKTINWVSNNKLKFIAGDSTSFWTDNVLEITGNASGSASDGNGFSMLVTTPLVRKFSSGCRKWLVQGIIQVAVSGAAYRSANLGEGACDDLIMIVLNGENYFVHTN